MAENDHASIKKNPESLNYESPGSLKLTSSIRLDKPKHIVHRALLQPRVHPHQY